MMSRLYSDVSCRGCCGVHACMNVGLGKKKVVVCCCYQRKAPMMGPYRLLHARGKLKKDWPAKGTVI